MEFNDEDEEEEAQEAEQMNLQQNDTVYNSPLPQSSSHLNTTTTTSTAGGLMVLHTGITTGNTNTTGIRFKYRECLKNQAVNIGGHALDGCGEFMPSGSEGTIESLKCAACNCHRNFHRKETNHQIPPPGFYRIPTPVSYQRPLLSTPPLQLALPAPPPVRERSDLEEDLSNYKMETTTSSGKRFRTKFTAEQKEMMLGLAERIGWRIQRQDDELIQRFCAESGVSRQVLKVWLHNNKHTLGKSSSSSSPVISHHHHHHDHHHQHQHEHQQQHQSLFHQEQDQP